MIRHTPFKPLVLPTLIASVLSASYSFNASADIYSDGYNAGYGAGKSSCTTPTCPTVSDRYNEGFSAGQSSCPTVTQPTCPTITQPTCPTVSDRYNEGYNSGVATCSGKINVSECASNGYTQIPSGQILVTIGQPYSCGTANTNNTYLTDDQKVIASKIATGSLKTYEPTKQVAVDIGKTFTDGTTMAAAKLGSNLDLDLPNLDASILSTDLKTSSAKLTYRAKGFVTENDPPKSFYAFTVESFGSATSLPNPDALVKLRLLSIGNDFPSTLTSSIQVTGSNSITDTVSCISNSSCLVTFKFKEGSEKITLPKVNGAKWEGDCSDTSGACVVDMNKPYKTVVLAFDKTSSPVTLNVTAGNTTLSVVGTTVTATTPLNASNTTASCLLATTNPLTYSLFVDGKCDSSATSTTVTQKDNKTISVVVPAVAATNSVTSGSLMVGTSATVLKDQSTSTLSLENTSTSIFVEAKLSCSLGSCNLSNTNTVSFVATQLVGSTLTSLTPATTVCKDNICTTSLAATNSSSTVMVSATFNGQTVGKQQFISIK